MIETKLDGKSKDIIESNIEKLKQIFPEIVTEDKIDFEKLQTILGEEIEEPTERYEFTWQGKQEAIKESQIQSTGTLRPSILKKSTKKSAFSSKNLEDSKNWYNTKNLYIEGDNLEVLKLLQKSYYEKVKMIYIDPPYNTGNDFVYKDDFKDNLKNYLELTGQISEDNNNKKFSTNPETEGRYHSNWLNMMYPRLVLARNLLKEDGVIFISIDDNEVANLKKICDDIFGENNFITEFIWQKTYSPKNNNKYVSTDHEEIICYAKNLTSIIQFNRLERDDETNKLYKYDDNDGRGKYRKSDLTRNPGNNYDICYNGKVYKCPESCGWRYNEIKMYQLIEDGRIYLPSDENKRPAFKRYLTDVAGVITKTILLHSEVGHTDSSKRELNKLIGNNIFDYPKPIELIKRFLIIASNKNDIILDFFSGSATTAHSVMQLNSEDNGNRKFIMVQLPEKCNEKSEAYKAGYSNICEIGKERIRRAGDKIVEESGNNNLDIGFKVFKLDSSNKLEWDPDYDNLESSLDKMLYNIKGCRTELDLVYEVMLKYGLDLSLPIENIEDVTSIYNVGFGALILCFKDKVTVADGKDIINIIKDNNPATCRVVFKDNSFGTDADKANLKELLSSHNVDEFITI